MVLLTITSAAKSAIELYNKLNQKSTCQSLNEAPLADSQVGDPVSHAQLIEIARSLKEQYGKNDSIKRSKDAQFDLETLLKGARIYTPPPKPKQAPV